jgi:hypothetical protein
MAAIPMTTSISSSPAPTSPSDVRPVITPRKAPVDVAGVPRHWFGGNPVATHIANGVNMLFPSGERFFVRSVNHYMDQITDPALRAAVKGFFGQEGRHAKAHDDYNQTLRDQGYQVDGFLDAFERIGRAIENSAPPALRLAATAAAEHFTAIMAEGALTRDVLSAAHPTMQALLYWHAAEEIEHKAVAFDVLRQVNPSYALRLLGLAYATLTLTGFWIAGAITLLRQDKLSWREIRAQLQAMRREDPIAKRVFWRGIREYVRRDFHPNNQDNYHLARDYFAAHTPAVTA